jgi:hypothetical protein
MSDTVRELVITYGSWSSNSTSRQITDWSFVSMDRDRAAVEFTVFLSGAASAAAFVSETQAAETAFSTPYQNLTVALGASNLIAVTQSGSTGLDAMPSIVKRGQVGDTGRSRVYRVRVEYGLPASWNATYPGLRDVTVTLEYTPARRIGWTIAGVFTAITSTDAKAQYEAQIATLASATASWLSIPSYELVSETGVAVTANRKTTTFARTFRELIFAQATAAVVEQSLVVSRDRRGIESQGRATPLQGWTATYTAWIDADVTTDLPGTYATIRSYALEKVRAILGSSAVALMSDSPAFDYDENRINATLSGMATDPTGGSVIEYTKTVTRDDKKPVDFVPAWSGNPYAAFVFEGVGILTRTTVERKRQIGSGGGGGNAGGGDPAVAPLFGGGGGGGSSVGRGSFFDIDLTTVFPNASGGGSPVGGADVAPGGAGGGAAAGQQENGGTWFEVSTSDGERPKLSVGAPGFRIDIEETTKTLVERWVVPIMASAIT